VCMYLSVGQMQSSAVMLWYMVFDLTDSLEKNVMCERKFFGRNYIEDAASTSRGEKMCSMVRPYRVQIQALAHSHGAKRGISQLNTLNEE
jgi:hypothetical protein